MHPPLRRLLLPLGLLAACGDPTAPPAPAADIGAVPQLAAGGATVETGTGTFVVVELGYLDCVGEDVHWDATVEFRYHLVTGPNGQIVYLEPFIPHSQEGTAVGQTTGTIWTLEQVMSPFVLRDTEASDLLQVTATQVWVSETGPTLHLHTLLHLSQNAAGEVVVDKFVWTCKAI